MIDRRTLCSESDKTRERAASSRDVPRDISVISLSSSDVILWRDESSRGETPKTLERRVIELSSAVKSSPALHLLHNERGVGRFEKRETVRVELPATGVSVFHENHGA
jgi:hypothetical protein